MNLGDRMEAYENVWHEAYLIPRMPVIIRVDGRAFHTLLRGAKKPFDSDFSRNMDSVAVALLQEIQNARCAYLQSDEISLLLIDYNKFDSQQWFGGNREKMISISAAVASATLTQLAGKIIQFDSRVFNLPEGEVVNYFIWRQRDWERNSIQMLARKYYSHRQLEGKNKEQLNELIFQKGDNWNDLAPCWKRGKMVTKELIDYQIPIFSQMRCYIEKFMNIEEE